MHCNQRVRCRSEGRANCLSCLQSNSLASLVRWGSGVTSECNQIWLRGVVASWFIPDPTLYEAAGGGGGQKETHGAGFGVRKGGRGKEKVTKHRL
jgi:hypothetical protein